MNKQPIHGFSGSTFISSGDFLTSDWNVKAQKGWPSWSATPGDIVQFSLISSIVSPRLYEAILHDYTKIKSIIYFF